MAQIVSAIVGAAAAKAVGGNAGAGAAAAASGTKWNFFGIAQRYDGSFISIADDMMVQEVENILIKEDGSKISRDEATQVLNDLAVLMETLEPDKTSSHFRLVEKFSSIVRLGEHLDVRHARRCLTLRFDTMQRWGSIHQPAWYIGVRNMAAPRQSFLLPETRWRRSGRGHTLLTMNTLLTIVFAIVKRVFIVNRISS